MTLHREASRIKERAQQPGHRLFQKLQHQKLWVLYFPAQLHGPWSLTQLPATLWKLAKHSSSSEEGIVCLVNNVEPWWNVAFCFLPSKDQVLRKGDQIGHPPPNAMSSHSQGIRGTWGSVQHRFSHQGTVVSLIARMGCEDHFILSTLNSHLPNAVPKGKPKWLSLRPKESPWSHTYLSFTSFPCWWIWFSIVKLIVAPCTCSPKNTFILDLYSSSWKYRIISGNHTVRP